MRSKWLALPIAVIAVMLFFLAKYNVELGVALLVVALALFFLGRKSSTVINDFMMLWKHVYNTPTGKTEFPKWEDIAFDNRALRRIGRFLCYQYLNKDGSISRVALDSLVADDVNPVLLKVPNDTASIESDAWFLDDVQKTAEDRIGISSLDGAIKMVEKYGGHVSWKRRRPDKDYDYEQATDD